MARVYVSSTIADLERERRAVLEWLRAAQHQVVHSYRPNSETIRDSCLEDVDTCDLYVLILGHRYGFQPADGNPEGLSITHLEFRRAGQSGIPRIALLRTSIPDVSLSDMEDPNRWPLVRAFRAEVAGEVRAAEFRDESGLIQGMSTGVLAELDKLSSAPVSAGLVLRLAPRPPLLAGREELLAELEDRLGGAGGSGPRIATLSGLAGAGKTSVAVEYAHRHLAEVGVAWQFAAEDAAVLAAGFTELATALGARAGAGDPVVAVHGALATAAAGWLLIFDNAPGPQALGAFVPPAGDGRVLITSQSALWPPGQGLDVPALDPQAAAGFLVARTGDPDMQAATGLARELGGLPLALEQAAAYLQATAGSLAGYLAAFRQRRDDMLARGDPAGYGPTIATTWSPAFGRLESSAPGAVDLLRLLAFCAAEAIPLSRLLHPRPGLTEQFGAGVAPTLVPLLDDELAVGDAVAALRRYSLVTPAGDGSVSVHRLVQAVTVGQMPVDLAGQWRQAAAALIEAAIPADTGSPETWPVCAALLPHAQAALAEDSDGLVRLANYLGERGSYAAAIELQQRVLDARERVLGPEHPHTLAARGNLAHWTGRAGDAAGARDQFAELLCVCERVLGSEHSATVSARTDLARWTAIASNTAASRDQTVPPFTQTGTDPGFSGHEPPTDPAGGLAPPAAASRQSRELLKGSEMKLFISYSHRDDRYREQLETHLSSLRRQGVIADWHDRKIMPGEEWRDAIDQNLDAADCVLLLVTPDFLASDYCYSIEMQRALAKHKEGRVLVIPVIVRPADWQHPPLNDLEALPKDAKPVVEWPRRDRAWLNVAEGIRLALAPSPPAK